MKILVYAQRDWSFKNIKPVLKHFEYDRWYAEMGDRPDFSKYDVIVTCEPGIEGWRELHRDIKGRHKTIGLQQNIYWSDKINPHAYWPCDKMMVYSEDIKEHMAESGFDEDRIIVTGNPRFDEFFGIETKDEGYILILAGNESPDFFPEFEGDVRFMPHPSKRGDNLNYDTEELIRNAKGVVFASTGAGIMAMVMDKPVMILEGGYINPYRESSYRKSSLYGTGQFGHDKEFVKWLVGGPGATDRVREAIKAHA